MFMDVFKLCLGKKILGSCCDNNSFFAVWQRLLFSLYPPSSCGLFSAASS